MIFHLDTPADRLLTGRLELVAGWIEDDRPGEPLSLLAGQQRIALIRCQHPGVAGGWLPPGAQGFYGFLPLRELLGSILNGFLTVDVLAGWQVIMRESFRVSPTAAQLAQEYPLNTSTYPVRADHNPFGRSIPPRVVIFPGLSAAGGSSINSLFRFQMYRNGWTFPVLGEANDRGLWEALRVRGFGSNLRWIDGHDCYRAGECLSAPWARVTVLRNPLPRMLTVFNYGRIVHPHEFRFATFEDFLASSEFRRYTQAFELLRIAGRLGTEAEQSDELLYREARIELERCYELVGITELFEETIFLTCLLAEIPAIGMWFRVLSTPKGLQPEDLAEGTRRRAEKALEVDYSLYREARTSFSRLVQTVGFGNELESYKRDSFDRRELPDSYKMAECLRWRQVMTDQRLSSMARERQQTES